MLFSLLEEEIGQGPSANLNKRPFIQVTALKHGYICQTRKIPGSFWWQFWQQF